jgi:hypothetical protein
MATTTTVSDTVQSGTDHISNNYQQPLQSRQKARRAHQPAGPSNTSDLEAVSSTEIDGIVAQLTRTELQRVMQETLRILRASHTPPSPEIADSNDGRVVNDGTDKFVCTRFEGCIYVGAPCFRGHLGASTMSSVRRFLSLFCFFLL